ncbi:hypothetical protein BGZ76_011684, partial [Entomortierella beljakovae]
MDSKEVTELCGAFATFMRDQLATTAGKVNAMHMESLRTAQGISSKQDGLEIVDLT